MRGRNLRGLAMLGLGGVLAACSSVPASDDDRAMRAEVLNAVLIRPGRIAAGQPTPPQLAVMVGAMYTTVICLRPADEAGTGWEEAAADDLGITFVRVPIADADGLTESAVSQLLEAERAATGGVLIYCADGDRTGALFAVRAYWIDGVSPEDALAIGRAVGLTALEPAVAQICSRDG